MAVETRLVAARRRKLLTDTVDIKIDFSLLKQPNTIIG
jgi:hypothetical protein